MSWKNISLRRGEVSVRIFYMLSSSVRSYYPVYQLNISILHRGVPPSCIQTSGQHITRCQVPLQPLISQNFSNVFCVQARRFLFLCFFKLCVCCVAACLMLCTRSSKTKFTACLSLIQSQEMHFTSSHTRGSSSSSSCL